MYNNKRKGWNQQQSKQGKRSDTKERHFRNRKSFKKQTGPPKYLVIPKDTEWSQSCYMCHPPNVHMIKENGTVDIEKVRKYNLESHLILVDSNTYHKKPAHE